MVDRKKDEEGEMTEENENIQLGSRKKGGEGKRREDNKIHDWEI